MDAPVTPQQTRAISALLRLPAVMCLIKRWFLPFPLLLGSGEIFTALASESDWPTATPGAPVLTLSISPTAPAMATVRVVVSGADGAPIQIEASDDLQNWMVWPRDTIDLEVPVTSSRRFFRAVVAQEGNSLRSATALGARLFAETRFAQFFSAHSGPDVNVPLATGDPTLDETITLTAPLPGPFAGKSMSCRVCHLVDEHKRDGLGQRTYSDFAIRSPLPDRGDGRKTTVRNSPPLANAAIKRAGPFYLHFDGEFLDAASLVKGTLTGRNFGWLPGEYKLAASHVARIIREDNGKNFGGPDSGGAYRDLFLGADPSIPARFRLPPKFRLDVATATDEEILDAIGTCVAEYLGSLRFARNSAGEYQRSPYDLFLIRNDLPRGLNPGEDDASYSQRLSVRIHELSNPVFVTPADGTFNTHPQEFRFGAQELEGLRIFLSQPADRTSPGEGRIGNCIACHPAPHFTDFTFHNNGATQWEYDSVHGEGAFARISIPDLTHRLQRPDDFLPPTPSRPDGSGLFLSIPSHDRPDASDLGLWNIYANPDYPGSQSSLHALLSARFGATASADLLPRTIGLFKTPGLRVLSFSAPYFHTGQASTIEATIFFYRFTSELARAGEVRNVDPEISRISLGLQDSAPLAAFLRSLNEDYE
jgi:cytochrome c peroxidase